jgi:hypothetical protein
MARTQPRASLEISEEKKMTKPVTIIDKRLLDCFIEMLPELLSKEEIKIEKIKYPGRNESNWDSPARQIIKNKLSSWMEKELGLIPPEIPKTLWVEGFSAELPSEIRGDFYGSVCCPDIALLGNDGYNIAIELDHGTTGASVRNAITKAAFNVLAGKFNRSIVLYFIDYKDKEKREMKFADGNPALDFFHDTCSTSIIFVTNYQPLP